MRYPIVNPQTRASSSTLQRKWSSDRGCAHFVSVQNISDEAYIVARRPAGVRPGLPRTFVAGLKFDI